MPSPDPAGDRALGRRLVGVRGQVGEEGRMPASASSSVSTTGSAKPVDLGVHLPAAELLGIDLVS